MASTLFYTVSDAHYWDSSYSHNPSSVILGGVYASALFSFAISGIPKGAIIEYAAIRFTASSYNSDTLRPVNVVVHTCIDPAVEYFPIYDKAAYDALSLSPGTAYTFTTAWTTGSTYIINTIKDEVQAAVNQIDFSGKAKNLLVTVKDGGGNTDSTYSCGVVPGSAVLFITYSYPDPPELSAVIESYDTNYVSSGSYNTGTINVIGYGFSLLVLFKQLGIPQDAVITSAVLKCYVYTPYGSGTLPLRISGIDAANAKLPGDITTYNSTTFTNTVVDVVLNYPFTPETQVIIGDISILLQEMISNSDHALWDSAVIKISDNGCAESNMVEIYYVSLTVTWQPESVAGKIVSKIDRESGAYNIYNGDFYTAASGLYLGNCGGIESALLRFRSIAIPTGKNVTNAWMDYYVESASTTVNPITVNVYGLKSLPADYTEYVAAERTTAYKVQVENSPFTAGEKRTISNITAIVQEILSDPNWDTYGSLLISLEPELSVDDDEVEITATREIIEYPPTLHIEWDSTVDSSMTRGAGFIAELSQAAMQTIAIESGMALELSQAVTGMRTQQGFSAAGAYSLSMAAVMVTECNLAGLVMPSAFQQGAVLDLAGLVMPTAFKQGVTGDGYPTPGFAARPLAATSSMALEGGYALSMTAEAGLSSDVTQFFSATIECISGGYFSAALACELAIASKAGLRLSGDIINQASFFHARKAGLSILGNTINGSLGTARNAGMVLSVDLVRTTVLSQARKAGFSAVVTANFPATLTLNRRAGMTLFTDVERLLEIAFTRQQGFKGSVTVPVITTESDLLHYVR